jgi:hypothetical protein
MATFNPLAARAAALIAVLAGALAGCGSSNDASFPIPEEPAERTLYDLVDGPIDRASALNLASGRSGGLPTTWRVDVTDQWDFCFGVVDGEPSWLPRGFFTGFEVSSGVAELPLDFDDVRIVSSETEDYEDSEPVPITVGTTYALRSRPDPSVSVSCRIYGKAEILAIEQDPARIRVRIIWNPNCNATNLAN